LVDEWEKDGSSKRLFYDRVNTYEDAYAIQHRYGVENVGPRKELMGVGIDYGQGMRQREIFAACARFKWLALKSTDEKEFAHQLPSPGQQTQMHYLPYSVTQLQSSTVGTKNQGTIVMQRRGVPEGFCISRLWSKPTIYPILYALKNGVTDRQFLIAKDIAQSYIDQLHAYSPSEPKDRTTNVPKPIQWIKIAPDDHSFVCSCQSLLLAIIAGFFPMTFEKTETLAPK